MRYNVLVAKRRVLEVREVKRLSLILVLTVGLIGAFAAVAVASPHSDSQKLNTSTCLTCHDFHQSVDQSTLVKASINGHSVDGVSEACIACHDGTGSSINVINGTTSTTDSFGQSVDVPNHGGLFAVTKAGNAAAAAAASASEHPVFSSAIFVYDAPGGKGSANPTVTSGTKTTLIKTDNYGSWDPADEFTCASCHDPHGSGGNPRLLNPNPNGVMMPIRGVKLGTLATYSAGAKYYFKDGTVVAGKTWADMNGDGVFQNAAYTNKGYTVTTEQTVTDLSNKLKPVMDTSAKVYVGAIDYSQITTTAVTVQAVSASTYTFGFEMVSGQPQAYIQFTSDPGKTGDVVVDYTPVMQVNMTFVTTPPGEQQRIQYGAGVQEFCGACHTDFVGSRSSSVAVYNTAEPYHHSGNRTNGNALQGNAPVVDPITGKTLTSTGSCLTCHYAHGVDSSVWAQTLGDNSLPNTGAYITDTTGNSNLKRLPNYGLCESCHRWEFKAYSPNNQFKVVNGAYQLGTPQ